MYENNNILAGRNESIHLEGSYRIYKGVWYHLKPDYGKLKV